MSRLALIVGARPNFVKMAPVLRGLKHQAPDIEPLLIHTGQHYDVPMSDLFFQQLGLPAPDVHLGVGSGTHGEQTARVLAGYEAWLLAATPRPAATVVVGDVNSTVACALAAVKLEVPVAHVEAGLRSFDRTMPEEINRVLTDAIADLLLVSEPSGMENLRREGRPATACKLVGNVMIDALHAQLPAARAREQPAQLGLTARTYAVCTLHRPANVDDPACLAAIVDTLLRIADRLPVVFPVHPRTRQRLAAADLWQRLDDHPGLRASAPIGYLELLSLMDTAAVVITDSGGIQEETTALGVPCLTLRPNTERPITISEGTNTLVGDDWPRLESLVEAVLAGTYKEGRCPALWDGRAGERIARELALFIGEAAA